MQAGSVGDGVAKLHAAVGGKADDVARVGFIHSFAPLAQEGDYAGGAQFFGGALYLELHACGVFTAGYAHKGNAVAVVGIHIGLHFKDYACKVAVFGLHGALLGLAID